MHYGKSRRSVLFEHVHSVGSHHVACYTTNFRSSFHSERLKYSDCLSQMHPSTIAQNVSITSKQQRIKPSFLILAQ